jgi:hypothetical protein
MIYIKRFLWILLLIISFPLEWIVFLIALIITPISCVIEYVIKGRVDYLLISDVVEKLDKFENWTKPE